jgi:hypothetical protein
MVAEGTPIGVEHDTVNNLMVNVLTITAHGPTLRIIRVTVIGRV